MSQTDVRARVYLDNRGLRPSLVASESMLTGFASRMAMVTAAAGVAAVGASVKAAIGFEQEMASVFTLLPGITKSAMDELSGQVLGFSKDLGMVPNEVVPALYDALSAGVPQDNVFEFMEVAGRAAIGGNLDVADSVDLLSTAVNAYAATGITASEASDLFFTTVRLGKTTVPELQSAFSNVGPVAAALGVGLDEVGASLAVLTASGVPTAQATTQMRAAISEFGKSGAKAATYFEEFTGETFPEFIAGGGKFTDALGIMADSGVPLIDMFGSMEAASAVMTLTANEGESLSAALVGMGESAGATDAAFETMDATTSRSFARIKAQVIATAITFGSRFLPVIEQVANSIGENWPAIEAVIVQVTNVIGETITEHWPAIRDTIVAVSTIVFDLVEEHWPAIRDTIVAVSTIVFDLVEEHWPAIRDTIVEVTERVFELVEEHWPAVRDTIVEVTERVFELVEEHWPAVRDTIVEVTERVFELIDKYWPAIWEIIKFVSGEILGLIEDNWPKVRDIILEAIGAVQAGIERVTAIIAYVWERWGDRLLEYADAIWSNIKEGIGVYLDLIKDIFGIFKALFEGDWSAMWEHMKSAMLGVLELIKLGISNTWEAIKLAAAIAWDLIRNEVLDVLRSLPGKFIELHLIMIDAGLALFGKVRDGMITVAGLALTAVLDWTRALPGEIIGAGVDLYTTGLDWFGQLADGLAAALASLPGVILDLVLGPLDDIYNKVTSVLGLGDGTSKVLGTGASKEGTTTSGIAQTPANGFYDDAVLLAGVNAIVLHEGGHVTQAMANSQPYTGLADDEVHAVLRVGEYVDKDGSSGGGPFIENAHFYESGNNTMSDLETFALYGAVA